MSSLSNDEFRTVTYKRKQKQSQKRAQIITPENTNVQPLDLEAAHRRIIDAQNELRLSNVYDVIVGLIHASLSPSHAVNSLVSFGIGHVADCPIARLQFALVLSLRDHFSISRVLLSDPALSIVDKRLITQFPVEIITENIEAKYKISDGTLFFLPHCPKQLTNNLLAANWRRGALEQCVVIANSFERIITRNTQAHLENNAGYILRIAPYVKEETSPVCDQDPVFNDLAVHSFPKDNLDTLPEGFWTAHGDPVYCEEDLEFIRAEL